MIAAWMATAVALGALLTIAALAIDHIFANLRRARRVAWVIALCTSIAWPAALFVLARGSQPASGSGAVASTRVQAVTDAVARVVPNALPIETMLIFAWIALTLICAGRLAWGAGALTARRRRWEPREIDGTRVWASNSLGPAVVGVRRMAIVLPKWAFELDAPMRALIVRHEVEHVRARDPYLLWLAALAVTAMPWNPALWLQARRLRLAIELDCDSRVLRAEDEPTRYSELLLTIAQRSITRAPALAPGLWESQTNLERRITAMMTPIRSSKRRLAALAMIGTAAIGIACAVDPPVQPTGPRFIEAGGNAQRSVASGEAFYEFQVAAPVKQLPGVGVPVYPASLKAAGVSGKVLAAFVVDTTGLADVTTFKVMSSTDAAFTAAVRDALPSMRFEPARLSTGRAVKQLLQLPFEFSVR